MTSPLFAADSFHRWRALVARALARRGVPAADRDDLVQEVFLVLHRRGVALADDRATAAWLRETAWRVASNHRRGLRRSDERTARVLPGNPTPTPEELSARAEIAQRLTSFLDDLPADTRVVFERIEIDGDTAPDVARGPARESRHRDRVARAHCTRIALLERAATRRGGRRAR
jgi:RNA polymerase sigma-70 factor (ECF subfamily)